MNTVAHMVIASAALARRDAPRRNTAILVGALAPDASMFVFFAWSRFQGWSGDETWNVQYWMEPWQTLGAISNSFVIFGVALILALWRKWLLLAVLSGAALLHIGLDFPLHADDAHRHFWPLTDWRFQSPVSYWDPDANGLIGGAIESVCALAALFVLWLRFSELKWRVLFSLLAALQISAMTAQIIWMG